MKLLVLAAHPDDAEIQAGGLISKYCKLGREVKIVSVTNGGAGHHFRSTHDLVKMRRAEAKKSGEVVGAEYVTWNFPDGGLQPSLEVREAVIRELRTFRPDLVVTHRPCDYHPDHRAVGQVVQDASYMGIVPLVCPDAPRLERDPVVAYMVDLFTKPYPFEPHVLFGIDDEMETILKMLSCHESQVFEWLPFTEGVDDTIPDTREDKILWLKGWLSDRISPRAERFRSLLAEKYGKEAAAKFQHVEAYEISEYALSMDVAKRQEMFPVD
jgi:LmbE family N-acetylglucosaminyl deacetylase